MISVTSVYKWKHVKKVNKMFNDNKITLEEKRKNIERINKLHLKVVNPKKLKIYWLLTTKRTLYPLSSGDVINETNIIKAISKYWDVYYNNQLFNPELKDFGIKDLPISMPTRKYDLYYVRNNPQIFDRLPQPKIWFASPYFENCYRSAKVVSTLTTPWTNNLKRYKYNKNYWGSLYPANIRKPKKVITINQVIGDQYSPKQGHPKTLAFRKQFGGGFIIGHFGRVSTSCYPHSFLHILPELKKKYPHINVVFSGNQQKKINSNLINVVKYINYDDIAYAISACDLILYNYRTAVGQYAGSMKGLEAMMCKVPVLLPNYDARISEFGKNYHFFYPYSKNSGRFPVRTENIMIKLISDYVENKNSEKYKKIKESLYERVQYFNMKNSSDRISKILKNCII